MCRLYRPWVADSVNSDDLAVVAAVPPAMVVTRQAVYSQDSCPTDPKGNVDGPSQVESLVSLHLTAAQLNRSEQVMGGYEPSGPVGLPVFE